MTIMDPIDGGKPFVVKYASSTSAPGNTMIEVVFIPRTGKTVPDPEHIFVVPGTTGKLEGHVPTTSDARRMEVFVDAKNGAPDGTLEVTVTGSNPETQSGAVKGVVKWLFIIT